MPSLRRFGRPGIARGVWVTAITLVVLIVAVGLMLPAVCRVRHTAARMQCSNNLKMIGLALHSYADASPRKGKTGEDEPALPAGTIPNSSLPPEQRLSWLVAIMPYIEANDLFSRLDHNAG